MENAETGHNMRARPNNYFLAALGFGTVAGLLCVGVGVVFGALGGLVVGLIRRNIAGSKIATSTQFQAVKNSLEKALSSDHAVKGVSITALSANYLNEEKKWITVSSALTSGSKMSDVTIGKTKITDITKSNDNKIIKFTLNGKELYALSGNKIEITPDNLKKVIFSAIAQNESNKNNEFEKYYTTNSDLGSSGTDGFSFWDWILAIDIAEAVGSC
ncbi:MAG: hypothetical protein JSS09_03460 [Verrucomicrobia bacterium]|nr:hypothetical protein [Verrucomicrobiota bacterium]